MRNVLLLLAVTACGSENKVDDDLGVDHTQDPLSTATNTETTPEDTDTTPAGDDDDDTVGDDDDATDTDTANDPDTTPIDPPTGLTPDEICEKAAALTITLDPYQTPADGRVVYCHSGSGGHYNYIESDISSCLPHIDHQFDVFPTSGCDS